MSMTSAASSSTSSSPETACPVCGRALPSSLLPSHVSGCLGDPVNPLALAEDLKAWLEPQFDAMERAGRPVPRLQAFADVLMSYHHRASVLVHGQSSVPEREAAADAAMDLGSVDDDEQFRLFLEREATCCLCKAVNAEAVIHLEECDHRVCRACLRGSLTGDAPYRERVQCPVAECEQSLPMFVCKAVLDASEYDALEASSLDSIVHSGAFVRCPSCKEVFAKEQGDVLTSDQDQTRALDGSVMTPEALRHRAMHRFRCKCRTDWCDLCEAVPYHNGFNCSDFKAFTMARRCRFCNTAITEANLHRDCGLQDVCCNSECKVRASDTCTKVLACNHPCTGLRGESNCSPCLSCPSEEGSVIADEFCNICWVESLGSAPCIRLTCGHHFHHACIVKKLEKKWPGSRISFGFLLCPLCKDPISHPSLSRLLRPLIRTKKSVQDLAMQRLYLEGLQTHPDITQPGGKHFQHPEEYAMDRFAYFMCHKCKRPYFGGMRQCGDMAGRDEENFNADELLCGGCSDTTVNCDVHGKDFIEYKCRFCCQVAVWFCWGTTHFCDPCHRKQQLGNYVSKKSSSQLPKCPGVAGCPLGVVHPPNGTEHSLGCALCRRGARSKPEVITIDD
ncbi:RING-type domain-containing protein [Plasmodiophora brassicae]